MKSRWTIILTGPGKQSYCECSCGTKKFVDTYTVKKMISLSCGCHRKELQTKPFRNTRAYITWENMKARCFNKNSWYYKYYGGRGIEISKRWMNFENFYTDMGEPEKGMTLERKNVNKGYSKQNCIWATRKTQQRNLRSNFNIAYKGKTQCLSAWAEETGINIRTLKNRIIRGWKIELAMNPTLRKGAKNCRNNI